MCIGLKATILVNLVILCMTFFPINLTSQYLFSYLGIEDGMSSRDITCITEDSEGYIWMGTYNGLNRFDGSGIKVYNHANHNYPPELNESIIDVIEYDQGTFIIGTSNGLICFDYYHHQFTPIDFSHTDFNTAQLFSIIQLFKDPLDRVWITTNQGLFVLINGKVLDARSILPGSSALDSVYYSGGGILVPSQNGIWLGTTNGLRFLNYLTGTVWSHDYNPDSIPVFTTLPIFGLTLDQKTGDLYWGDGNYLLNKYDATENTTHKIIYDSLSTYYNGTFIYKDQHERLWVSTWQWSIFVIQPDSTFIKFPDQSDDHFPLSNVFAHEIIETRKGDLWLATAGGAFKLSSTAPLTHIFNIFSDDKAINDFMRTSENTWLIAKENGLQLLNETNRQVKAIQTDGSNYQANRFFDITPVANEWWCGTGNGIKIFNPISEKFRSLSDFEYSKEINSRSVIQIMQDQKGFIWISVWATYLYRFNPRNNECIRFDGNDPAQGDIEATNCLSIKEAQDGKIWVAHINKGVRIFDYSQNAFYNPIRDSLLNASVVNGIDEDNDHNMWLSTDGNGIYAINPDGIIVKHFTTEDGLSLNRTNSLAIGQNNIVWFATFDAIHYLKPDANRVETIHLGLKNSDPNYWMHIELTEKYNYVAVYDQIFRIDLQRIMNTSEPEAPLITGISIFGEDFPFSPLNPSIDLNHKENFFRIEYSSTQHIEKPSIQYEYQLTGFDQQWVKSGRNLSASYTNVPPGNYTFNVRTVDPGGTLVSSATSIPILIKPPFWQTSWFYLLCAASAIALAYQLYRLQNKRSDKKERRSDH